MSGGADKGAYQAAVFNGLAHLLPEEEVAYDVIVGVSAGALNSLSFSVFTPEQAKEAGAFALALWNTIPSSKAYNFWPGGILDGIFFRKGVLDISAGMDFVRHHFQNKTINRRVTFTSTDINTGAHNPIDYEATFTWPEGIVESVFASCIIPFAFGQVQIGNKTLLDGGVKWKLDVLSPVRRCKELGFEEKDIIVDMILCANPVVTKKDDVRTYSALGHFLRGMEMTDYYQTLNDYNSSIAMFPEVTFRYLVSPSESISSGTIPLNYNQEQINRCMRVGQKDAENAVKLGPGVSAKLYLEYHEKVLNGEAPDLDHLINSKIRLIEDGISKESS